MIKSLFFIFCCIMPCAAEAGEILNVQDGFKIAKAVKLGRGNAYSVSANAHLNIGKTEIAEECDSNCADCETSSGYCNTCKSGYGLAMGGKCVSCGTNCSSCFIDYYGQVDCLTCSGNNLLYVTNNVTPLHVCVSPCAAGTFGSNNHAGSYMCWTCPSDTYAPAGTLGQCLPCPSEESTNGDCGDSGFTCTVDWTPSSDGTNCTKCADGTYSNGSNMPCKQCPTGCNTCKGNNLTMGADCLSCKDGYEMTSGSNCVASENSSGSNSGSNSGSTTTRTCASEYSSKLNTCETSEGDIYCCPNPQDCDPSGVPQGCTKLW